MRYFFLIIGLWILLSILINHFTNDDEKDFSLSLLMSAWVLSFFAIISSLVYLSIYYW